MHRAFVPEPVEDELVARLLWAAGRAPMAGNELVRRFVLVDDPALVRAVRELSPSFLADAPAFILVCTDLELAGARMGPLGRDAVSLLDAGAAAENIALMAVALGLGVCFVRSATDAALRRLLGIPDSVRPDLIVAYGRPAARPSASVPHRPPVVYHNVYGVPWPKAPR
jgi:nitroreductase